MLRDFVQGLIGRYSGGAGFDEWRDKLAECAACPNVILKLGGLHMSYTGLGVDADAPRPRTSSEMADAHGHHLLTAVDTMGASRCMFESNFPVDGMQTGATVLWNAYKLVIAALDPADRNELFSGTAIRVYDLTLPML